MESRSFEKPIPTRSVQLGEGFHAADAFTTIKAIPTLRSFSINDGRLPLLSALAHLKTQSPAPRPKGYPEETQARVNALLLKVALTFP